MYLDIKLMVEQEQMGGTDCNMEDKQPFDNAQGKEAGWEMKVPRFMANPLVWIVVIVIVAFFGYQLLK